MRVSGLVAYESPQKDKSLRMCVFQCVCPLLLKEHLEGLSLFSMEN